ncbi:MAG: hypothetical protein RLZ35_989 [Pseudomonadota bacterium]|jgi:uncharacterized RDD family membrane protein YckC
MMLKRFFALCYDLFLLICVWLIVSTVLVIFLKGNAIPPNSLWYQCLLLAIAQVFFIGFWCFGRGQTVGLKAWGLRLAVDSSTQHSVFPPTIPLKKAFIYFWLGALSLVLMGAGWCFMRGNTQQRSWAERICGLKVGV